MSKSNADVVFEAIQDLHAQEQIVTRKTLAKVCNFKLSVIDDRLSHLIDHGKINRVERGVFVPAPVHKPARIITRTLLPDGGSVLEIGDDVINLTPREARLVGEAMAGAGQQYAAIETGHFLAALTSEIGTQLKQMRAELKGVQGVIAKPTGALTE